MIAGSDLVPVISRPPATLPRRVCVATSKVTNYASMLFSAKYPSSLAIYGGMCTTFGGVTGTPKTTLCLVCACSGLLQSQTQASVKSRMLFFIVASFYFRTVKFLQGGIRLSLHFASDMS